jgi:hypothetical protein
MLAADLAQMATWITPRELYSKLSSLLVFLPRAHYEVTSKLESLLYTCAAVFIASLASFVTT